MQKVFTFILGIGCTCLLLAGCSKSSTPSPTPGVMQNETGVKIDESMMMESDAKQVAFTSEAAAQAMVAKGPVVYFFKASWCPTCQALQKELNSDIGKLPTGTSVVIVDYDNSSALKTKYAVTYQHTLVQIDATGKEITKWQGGGVAEIARNIK